MKKSRSGWKVLARLLISGLLLAWIFHTIFVIEGRRYWESGGISQGRAWRTLSSLEQGSVAWRFGPGLLWDTIRTVEPIPLLISLLCMGATILLGVIRWRMVLAVQGLPLSFPRASEISLVAHFFNSFLLGSTGGDLLKAYYAARETHHKKTEAVLTVFMDRLLGLFAMLLFAALMMLPNFQMLLAHRKLAALSAFILTMLAGCGGLVVLSIWGGWSRYFPWFRERLKRLPKAEIFERALEASRLFGRRPKFLCQALGISMLLNLFCVWQIKALAAGLGVETPPLVLYVIVPVIVCISALPITPSGLGVRENLYVLMLAVPEIAVEPARALSISLLAYGGSLFWSVVGGIVYASRKNQDQLDEVTRAESG